MRNTVRFIMKDWNHFVHGAKEFLNQPVDLTLSQRLLRYTAKSKIVNLLPWARKGCVTAGFPLEFIRAFDVFPYLPEAYACYCGAADLNLPPLEHAESLGFSQDLCSYMKTSMGARLMNWPLEFGGVHKPDFWASANMVCDTHVKWFETEARDTGTPYFGLDVPSYVSGEDEGRLEEYIDYLEQQFHDLIQFLEGISGKTFDEEKFLAVVKKSEEACRLYLKLYEYRKKIPASSYFEFQRLFMLPVVVQWNIDDCLKYYRRVLEETEKRHEGKGDGELRPREKYRVLWEGITIWYKVDLYRKELRGRGVSVVHEPYTYSFAIRKKSGLPFRETLRQIAGELLVVPYTYNLDARIDYFEGLIDEYDLDGIILHANLSCRPSSTGMQDLRDALQKSRGIPVLILNCDMDDPRTYAEAAIRTRIDGFVELMEEYRKAART